MTEKEQCGVFADLVLREIKKELLVSDGTEVVTKAELYDMLQRANSEAQIKLWEALGYVGAREK